MVYFSSVTFLFTHHSFIYLIFQPEGIKLNYEDCRFPLLMFIMSKTILVYSITSILDIDYNSSMSDQLKQNLTSTKDDEKHFLFGF